MAKHNKRGASRGPNRKRTSRKQVPGWVWLFTGLMVGLFVAFLFHLGKTQMQQGESRSANTEETRPETESEDKPPKTEPGDEPKFDFYAVLPKMEVIVPQDESEKQQARQQQQQDSQPRDEPASQPRPQPEPAAPSGQRYLLQAGSFRNTRDADRRRAELILQGFQASIQAVNLNGGDNWHRVMIGPYDNLSAMRKAKRKLASNGIETLPIKMKQ